MNTQKSLYRDPKRGKVAGVCAGLADYFNVEVWLVRIITITAFLLTSGSFVLVGYVAAWLILDKKSELKTGASNSYVPSGAQGQSYSGKGYTNPAVNSQKVNVKAKVWQAGMPPKQAFLNIQQRFIRSENRLRKLESYVTSKEFQINRELNGL
ncbi:envelope stress response membrane protein PspC [Glaciecola siphonariae]|uniref:Envelope stress response membrane protein PspC n=1 Tax=Glaciecola siphonariae TaxID=521012 RepID=A0ABV9LTL9_9ALTE